VVKMDNKDSLKIKGKVEIFDLKTKEKLYEKDNLVVNTGLTLIIDRLKTNTINPLSHIAVGTGDTPVSATDTQLENEIMRKAISDIDTVGNILTAKTQFEDWEAIEHWREIAIFNAPAGGVMLNRVNIDFEKTTQDAVEVKFTLTITS